MGMYSATNDFEEMLHEESSPPNVYQWNKYEYAYKASYRMVAPFRDFGITIEAIFQVFLPIKLIIVLWLILFTMYPFPSLSNETCTEDE